MMVGSQSTGIICKEPTLGTTVLFFLPQCSNGYGMHPILVPGGRNYKEIVRCARKELYSLMWHYLYALCTYFR